MVDERPNTNSVPLGLRLLEGYILKVNKGIFREGQFFICIARLNHLKAFTPVTTSSFLENQTLFTELKSYLLQGKLTPIDYWKCFLILGYWLIRAIWPFNLMIPEV